VTPAHGELVVAVKRERERERGREGEREEKSRDSEGKRRENEERRKGRVRMRIDAAVGLSKVKAIAALLVDGAVVVQGTMLSPSTFASHSLL
jgi:hypothetical protein